MTRLSQDRLGLQSSTSTWGTSHSVWTKHGLKTQSCYFRLQISEAQIRHDAVFWSVFLQYKNLPSWILLVLFPEWATPSGITSLILGAAPVIILVMGVTQLPLPPTTTVLDKLWDKSYSISAIWNSMTLSNLWNRLGRKRSPAKHTAHLLPLKSGIDFYCL